MLTSSSPDQNSPVNASLSRNEQVYKYFAQQCPTGIPRTHLVKITYMADIVARQYLGHQISKFDWRLYLHGPYPFETPGVIRELEEKGFARSSEPTRANPYEHVTIKLYDTGRPAIFDFSMGEIEILGCAVRWFMNMSTSELIDIVYATAPMQAVLTQDRLRVPLPMDLVDNEGAREIGFDLERVLKAERQVEEGNFVTGREYFDAVRNRVAARHTEPN